MKKHFLFLSAIILLSFLTGFTSCESTKEKRQDIVINWITSYHQLSDNKDIDIQDIFFIDEINPDLQDTINLKIAQNIISFTDSIKVPIERLKHIYPNPEIRIWRKTMPDSIENLYQDYIHYHYGITQKLDSINGYYSHSKDYKRIQIVKISYKIEPYDTVYTILGYFNNDANNIYFRPNYYVFKDSEYKRLQNLLDTIKQNKYFHYKVHEYLNVDLEAQGYDFVPEDEDPQKTKAERQEEKDRVWKEKMEKEEAERKRKEEQENKGKITAANSTNQYIVTTDYASAAVSKEANKRLTQYSINNDEFGIASMIVNGEVEILMKGDIVSMIDLGVLVSKVRLASGREVYIDTSFIKKK